MHNEHKMERVEQAHEDELESLRKEVVQLKHGHDHAKDELYTNGTSGKGDAADAAGAAAPCAAQRQRRRLEPSSSSALHTVVDG